MSFAVSRCEMDLGMSPGAEMKIRMAMIKGHHAIIPRRRKNVSGFVAGASVL